MWNKYRKKSSSSIRQQQTHVIVFPVCNIKTGNFLSAEMLLLARHQLLIPHGVCTKWDKYSMQLTKSTKEAYRIQGQFLNVFRGKTIHCSRIVWRSLRKLKTLCGALSKVVVANLLILYFGEQHCYCFCSKFKSVSNYIDRKNFHWLPILAYKNMLLTSASGNVPTTLNRSQIPEGL